MDRRDFLKTSGSLLVLPYVGRGVEAPRSLVVIELAGGNDGLNTVVPTADDAYVRARPQIAVRSGTHRLSDELGLHPNLGGLARLYRDGDLTVVLGVGYPEPNRSHFRSMDIWQSARPDIERPVYGWLGAAADELRQTGSAVPAVAVGSPELPLMLHARKVVVPALASLEAYQVWVDGRAGGRNRQRVATLENVVRDATGDDALAKLLKKTARQAYEGAAELRKAAEAYVPRARYPRSRTGRRLELCARALSAPLGTRIVHLRQTGFDTHAGQQRTHPLLMRELGDAVAAFAADMKARRLWDRTLVVVFSEFGRRVAENQSRGTDHGTAGPVFVAGGAVAGGLHGRMPSLADLDHGDLKFHVDFRSIYRDVLEGWLGVASKKILHGDWPRAGVLGRG